jgi:hypothetical protein
VLIGHRIWQPGGKGSDRPSRDREQWKPVAANIAISVVGFDRSGASCGLAPSVKDWGPLECAVIFWGLQVAGRLGVVRGAGRRLGSHANQAGAKSHARHWSARPG